MKYSTIDIVVLSALFLLVLAVCCFAGDTYNCINSKGDYINYGLPKGSGGPIIVAPDSARYEPRWQPMLGPDDLKELLFEQARHHNDVIHIGR